MRKMIGHAPLVMTACGVLIENPNGELLLQRRKDNGLWGRSRRAMEPGETFEEAARREVREETGLLVGELKLVGIYSGPDQILTYPNGDVCCYTGIVFYTTSLWESCCKRRMRRGNIAFLQKARSRIQLPRMIAEW
mgnify:CR=1 FL=1